MVRGSVDMNMPSAQMPELPDPGRLQTGSVFRLESIHAMGPAWHGLGQLSDLPTTQFEWATASIDKLPTGVTPHIAYVTDGSRIRAVLPMMVRRRFGVEHFYYLGPAVVMPIDILHTDRVSLEVLLNYVLDLGRPIVLRGIPALSPTLEALQALSKRYRALVSVEKDEPVTVLDLNHCLLQDRIQSTARVSILSASYGLSGGPSDVLFQFASPTLEQVANLFHESRQLDSSTEENTARRRGRDISIMEFLRVHANQSAQRGEIRFSCLRLGGKLLAVQLFQCRKQTAWLIKAGHMDRFRGTTLDTLLMGEAIRRFREEGMQRIVVPSEAVVKELGQCQPIERVTVRIHPWSPRSITAKLLSSAGNASGRLFVRKPKRG